MSTGPKPRTPSLTAARSRRLIQGGLIASIVACVLLIGVAVHSPTLNWSFRAAAETTRAAAVAARLASELPNPATPDAARQWVREMLPLTRAEVAFYAGARLVAASRFGGSGAAPLGQTLPAEVQARLAAGRDVFQADQNIGETPFHVRYRGVFGPGGAWRGAVLVAIPSSVYGQAALFYGGTAMLASLAAIALCGLIFILAGGRLAAEARSRAEELDAAHRSLATALSGMSQGLCIFGPGGILTHCNQHFSAMHDLPPGAIKPGMTFKELFVATAGAGDATIADLDDFVAARMADLALGRGTSQTVHSANGREIVVTEHPLAGGGWLAIMDDMTDKRRAESELKLLKQYDRVTGLPNRAHLEDLIQQRFDTPTAALPRLLLLDLSRFNTVAETLPREIMDRLVLEIAERARAVLPPGAVLARVRGDQFAILPAAATGLAELHTLAAEVLAAVNPRYQLEGQNVAIAARIGVAVAQDEAASADRLFKNANIALQSLAGVGPGIGVFSAAMEGELNARIALDADMAEAIEAGQFQIFYQPLIEMRRNRVSCLEALLRWHHPVRGLVQPADFIPLAEANGQIVALGEWVLRRACRDAIGWPCHVRVAVNLSAIQIRDPGLLQTVQDALRQSGLLASRLELEVTETVMLEGDHHAKRVLHALRALGVRISMDDFGTGHSSLSYLRDFPFDKIKIDRSFVQDLLVREDCLTIVRAVTGLAGSLGIAVTAEGAEQEDQVECLRHEGCTEVQGYYYSRPRPLSEIEAMLTQDFTPVALAVE